jgi:WD40 repeat protein
MKPSLTIIFLLLILAACASKPTQNSSSVLNTATYQPTLNNTLPATETATLTPRPTLALTPTPPTIPAATLIAIATSEALEKSCDQFESDSNRSSEISPYGEWFAINCGYKRNQEFIVQNQEGVKWVFNFADFLSPDLKGIMGQFIPLAWSSDGRFLYFTRDLGFDGGGNQCFPGYGVYGLYRLTLKTGKLATLVPSNNSFPGNKILFSPNNQYYAAVIGNIRITNFVSGKVTTINKSNVMEMSWSPDSRFLAFSVASCGETLVESSSIFVWDSSTNQMQALFSTKEMLLRPASWISNSTLRFEGETWVGLDNLYTIFECDLAGNKMILSGTATPRP